jgi:hypothetical protein
MRKCDKLIRLPNWTKKDRDEEMRKKQGMRCIQVNELQRNAGLIEEWL